MTMFFSTGRDMWNKIIFYYNNLTERLEGMKREKLFDRLFYLLLAAYLLHYQCKLVAWTAETRVVGDVGAMLFLDASFFIALIYITFFVLSRSIKPLVLVLTGAADVAMLIWWPRLDYNVRCWIINLVLIFTAAGLDFHKILKVYLIVYLIGFAAAVTGLASGYSVINHKWQNYGVGLGLGYISGNNMTRMLLWMAMIITIFLGNRKPWLSRISFLLVFLVSCFYAKCRTTAVMAVLVPLMLFASERSRFIKTDGKLHEFGKGFLILTPFSCTILSVVLSFALIPLIPAFRNHSLWNFLSRFVQNNIALREYGVHLTGRWIDFLGNVSRNFYGETIFLKILDNAYVPWMIRNGLIKMLLLMGALCLSMAKAVKKNNIVLCVMFLSILIYGIMEPAAVQLQYNFMLLYLFAKDHFSDRQTEEAAGMRTV